MDVLKFFIDISSKLLIVNFLFAIETWNSLSKDWYSYAYLFPYLFPFVEDEWGVRYIHEIMINPKDSKEKPLMSKF
jgi:hypothetical protein